AQRIQQVPASAKTGFVQPGRGNAAGAAPPSVAGARVVDKDALAERGGAFYERHPYPPPVDGLDGYRRAWQDRDRRRADHHLFLPARACQRTASILIAGGGTSQAAKHAMRWPDARVTGIDF